MDNVPSRAQRHPASRFPTYCNLRPRQDSNLRPAYPTRLLSASELRGLAEDRTECVRPLPAQLRLRAPRTPQIRGTIRLCGRKTDLFLFHSVLSHSTSALRASGYLVVAQRSQPLLDSGGNAAAASPGWNRRDRASDVPHEDASRAAALAPMASQDSQIPRGILGRPRPGSGIAHEPCGRRVGFGAGRRRIDRTHRPQRSGPGEEPCRMARRPARTKAKTSSSAL